MPSTDTVMQVYVQAVPFLLLLELFAFLYFSGQQLHIRKWGYMLNAWIYALLIPTIANWYTHHEYETIQGWTDTQFTVFVYAVYGAAFLSSITFYVCAWQKKKRAVFAPVFIAVYLASFYLIVYFSLTNWYVDAAEVLLALTAWGMYRRWRRQVRA